MCLAITPYPATKIKAKGCFSAVLATLVIKHLNFRLLEIKTNGCYIDCDKYDGFNLC